jgi:hypothetical protein
MIKDDNPVAKTFGILKQWKEPTDKILRQMRRECWGEL